MGSVTPPSPSATTDRTSWSGSRAPLQAPTWVLPGAWAGPRGSSDGLCSLSPASVPVCPLPGPPLSQPLLCPHPMLTHLSSVKSNMVCLPELFPCLSSLPQNTQLRPHLCSATVRGLPTRKPDLQGARWAAGKASWALVGSPRRLLSADRTGAGGWRLGWWEGVRPSPGTGGLPWTSLLAGPQGAPPSVLPQMPMAILRSGLRGL